MTSATLAKLPGGHKGPPPRRPRGRSSFAAEQEYRAQVDAFCRLVLEINSSFDSARLVRKIGSMRVPRGCINVSTNVSES